MYKGFYNLLENPFNVTSDPEFFFSSTHHAEAFSHLAYGIQNRKGILVVTGEIGTGKTTLCRTLLSRLDENVKTAFVLNPYFSETQLLQLIVKDLGIPRQFSNKLALTSALNEFLIEQTQVGNNVVIIIDEAQDLNIKQLEQIRLLSNLETNKTKLLQILLVGQPELLDKLKLPALRQIDQRVAVRYHIMPLSQNETREYIYYRLKLVSKGPSDPLAVDFTPEALESIYFYSGGTPRLINILCDRALLSGYVLETRTIDKQIVFRCAREVGIKHEHYQRCP